jgi:Outer membrane protein beta-barrel domain
VPRWLLFTAVILSSLAGAQPVSFGVVGGASVTGDFRNSSQPGPPPIITTEYSAPERYIVGAMLEFQLPQNWSIEVDGMYHPLRYDLASILPGGAMTSPSLEPVITWEFPVLAKYRFHWRTWRPFVEAGPSFRTAGNLNGANPSHYGVAVGAGAEARLGKLSISPEIRYIRWAADGSGPYGSVATLPNQIELLTSFSTGAFSEGGHALGGSVSLGVVIGATLTPDARTYTGSSTSIGGDQITTFTDSFSAGTFLVGPMVEIALAKGFFLEGDAIDWPVHDGYQFNTISSWNFPVLGKYKFSMRRVKPFVEAGPSFRLATELTGTSPYGVTAGAGIETHFGRVKIALGVRYTHWGQNAPNYPGTLLPYRNQAALLAGFFF